MTALVTKHLSLVAGAPDGIKKLRALILELAVRGRLVNQDSSDEPAIEFLKRLTFAKSEFEASRSRRSLQENQQASVSVHPFQAPAGWVWTTFGAATICRDGERVPVSQVDREGRAKIYDYYGASGAIDKIDNYIFDKPLLLIGEDGANLINRSTPIAFIARGRYWVNNHAHVIDGISEAYLEYLALFINAIDLKPYVTGTAQPKMNQAKLNSIPVPLPPEPEQKRIVAKVDELMALCDRLEADQADAEAAHAQLVQALLDSLTQATDAADFRASWQRLSEHFHTLFTTEASIDALKQTVLQLAVTGRLVPQEKSEASAVQLLEEIKRTQAALVETEGLRTSAQVDVPPAEQYVELPDGWSFYRLGNLAKFIDYRGRTPVKTTEGIPLITAKNVRRGFVSREPAEFIATTEYAKWMTRGIPRVGDILFTTEAPLGNVALIDIGERFALAQRVICFQLHLLNTGPYLRVALMSQVVQEQIAKLATGMTATGVKSSKLKELPLPIPPLAEQHRIVAKVDELLALCDQLKAQLVEARQQHAQIAAALVEQAVA